MLSATHHHTVLHLARQKGLLCPKDLDAIGAHRIVLTRLHTASLLDKIGRGLYCLPYQAWSERLEPV